MQPDIKLKISRLLLVGVLGLLAGSANDTAVPDSPADPPNILLVMTDDQGWGDIRSHGNAAIDTPVMDRLAREGVRFERFYVSPVCAPTRASLLTGRDALRTGVHGVTRAHETMRAEEVTLAEALRDAGYATGMFGKWHNGAHYPYDPNGQGFDEFLGFTAGHWNNYFDTQLEHNGRLTRTAGYITDVLTDAAVQFIEQHRAAPFFAYVAYNAPHSPFQVPDAYYDKYIARGLDSQNASVYGMVENVDDNLGRLLDTLDQLELSRNTIVVFLTDNGPNGCDRYNGDMKGCKGHVDEGGVRVPLFVRWPAELPRDTVVRTLAAHIDVMPTLLDLAGVTPAVQPAFDGRSLAPLMRGEPAAWPDRELYSHWYGGGVVQPYPGSVRTERWRAVNKGGGWELYDMLNDPGQHVEVGAQYPEVVSRLDVAYRDWFARAASGNFDPIPTPIGYEERPTVTLPGHEAYLIPSPGAGINYDVAAGWANDWVTDWTDPAAYAMWPVDVVATGRYEITLLYTCPPAHVGGRLRVEIGGEALEKPVERAHDPLPVFSPDRVLRKEVYEKEWASLAMGTVRLEAGVTQLAVRAATMENGGTIDLKAVQLRRVR
ncbi:MAG: arylsulfatase [Rhodothermales bacterium]